MADNYNFEKELYEAISMLEFWDDGKANATDGGVVFQVPAISGVEDFTATGLVSLDLREEEQPVEFLSIDLVLARNADPSKETIIKQKLYDLNLGLKEGMFYVDSENNLAYEMNFPIIRDNVVASLQLFIAVYNDMSNYIDGVYPYILRLVAKPDDSNFNEYLAALIGEEE